MKISRIVITVFILLISISFSVYADAFPEEGITICVENPPNEEYVVSLLKKSDNNNSNEKDSEYINANQAYYLDILENYNEDGWQFAFKGALGITVNSPNEKISESFIGFSSKNFKIIVITKSGKISVSDCYEKTGYLQRFVYDYQNKKIISQFDPYVIIQLLITLLITLLIEFPLLILFGFKKHIKVFLMTNISTQLFLYLMIYLTSSRIFTNVIMSTEIIIFIAEALIYLKFFKGSSKIKTVIYTITANLASVFAGEILLFLFSPF